MKSRRANPFVIGAFVVAALAALGYWAWTRAHRRRPREDATR